MRIPCLWSRLHDHVCFSHSLIAHRPPSNDLQRGFSVSIWMAVVGRVIAGIGGAGMADLISVLITGKDQKHFIFWEESTRMRKINRLIPSFTDMAPLKQIAMLRSYIAMVSTMGHASGAPIGGLLTTLVGWRWYFTQCRRNRDI